MIAPRAAQGIGQQRALKGGQRGVVNPAGRRFMRAQPGDYRSAKVSRPASRLGALLGQQRLQRGGIDLVFTRQQGQPVDEIAQLADIAAPGLLRQLRGSGIAQAAARQPFPGRLLQEMPGQRGNVIAAFAQRRQGDRHHVEPVKQVFAEQPGGNHRRQVLVGRSDDPHIHRNLGAPANPADLPRLQRAQQAGLRLQRHIANLIEKQRAAMGLLKFAGVARDGAGERALLMPEQLAFDQLGGNGGSVDRHERPVFAVAQLMDRLGHQFLAGPAFAQHQHGQIIAQDPRNHAVHRLHRGRAPNQRQAGHRRFVLPGPAGRRLADRLTDRAGQLVDIEWLGKILKRPGIAGAHRRIERVLRREDDDRHVGRSRADFAERFDPIAIGQHHIGDQHRIAALGQQAVAFGDAIAAGHCKTFVEQRGGDHQGDGGVVFDQQDGHAACSCCARRPCSATGKCTRKCVQPPARSRS